MDPKEYKETLDRAVRLAHEGRNCLSEEEYERIFKPLNMTEEQDKLTRDYLNSLHIRFGEYTEEDDDLPELTAEDGNYLEFYLEGLKSLPQYTEEEKAVIYKAVIKDDDEEAKKKLVNIHLPDVVDIAKLYVYHGMRLEDLIGEGNIGLMMAIDLLGTVETKEEAEGLIGKTIMDAIDSAIKNDLALKDEIDKKLERINEIQEAVTDLSTALRRDLTIEELIENSDFTLEEIEEALFITGNSIEGLEILDSSG